MTKETQQKTFTTGSPEETMDLAVKFARQLTPGDIVLLQGDLGAGKTVFTKGIAKALGVNPRQVNSPTFVVMNVYEGKLPIYHFDAYRLNAQEIKSVQFDEYLYGEGISVIEWPERLEGQMPKEYWLVELKHKNENERSICISYPSNPQRKF